MEIELYGFYERYLFSDVVKSKTKSVLYLPCFALACSGLFCFGFAFCFVFLVIMCISIYHTSEQYFSHALIGQLGGDQPSTIHLRAAEEKQNGFCRCIFTNKVTLWAASYSACVVYTKPIIHLSVGERGGYLPPLR